MFLQQTNSPSAEFAEYQGYCVYSYDALVK